MIARILLVAGNTFRGVMSGRAVYIWGAGFLLMLLRSAPVVLVRSDSEALITFARANAISGSLSVWATLTIVAAAFVGANAIASETTSKVIVTILARPVRRWELLAGRWLGIVLFFVLTLALGIVLGTSLAWYLGIEVSWRVLAMAATLTIAAIVLDSGVAVALSAFLPAGLAGALTVLLVSMPPLVTLLTEDPGPVRHRIGVALGYGLPPALPPIADSRYDGVTWAPRPFPVRPNLPGRPNVPFPPQARPTVDYAADRQLIVTALGYALVYFAAGCALFTRRDLRLG